MPLIPSVRIIRRFTIVASCALSIVLAPWLLRAQSEAASEAAFPTGFRVGLSGWLGQPHLGGDAQSYLEQYGEFGWQPGGTLELGLDFAHFALSAALDFGETSFVADQTGYVTAISLMADWRPTTLALGGWQPLVSIGAIHEEIDMGGVNTGDRVFDFPFVSGSGARIGMALEHKLGKKTAVLGRTSIDVLSVNQRSSFNTYDIHRDGWGLYPRFSAGLRWWPFSQRSQ